MTANSLKRSSTEKLRLLLIGTLIVALGICASLGPVAAGAPTTAIAPITILDTLAPATPDTTFSVFGAGGPAIIPSQRTGPEFTLTQPTVITEIGGFVNNCNGIIGGQVLCLTTLPFTVEIRPSLNGVPDPSVVLATFTLSHDNDPLTYSYESVATNLLLQPGTYFALFAAQGSDAGSILGNATIPFSYQATLIDIGRFNPLTGISAVDHLRAAVRILGEPVGACPNSDRRATVIIDDCDSGVANTVFPTGCTISDLISQCAEDAGNHGQFVSCVSHLTDSLMKDGTITGQQKGAIQKCAAHDNSSNGPKRPK